MTQIHHDLVSVQKHRVRLLLRGSGILMMAIGVPWGIHFAIQGLWLLTVLDAFVAGIGLAVAWCASHDRLRWGSALFIGFSYLVVCMISLGIDVPDGLHPRSAHVFLLALAFSAYLALQLENRMLRYGVPALCMLTFLILASSPVAFPIEGYTIPPAQRELSTWFHHFTALVCLFTVMVLLHADIRVRTAMEAELRAAILAGQMVLHYQPQVAHDGRVVGVEALVRWRHPTRGIIAPGEFIGLAEQCGLMPELGQTVLTQGCRQLAQWARRPERAALTLSVNVSAAQLHQPGFVQRTLGVIEGTRADPKRLKIELTETMLVNNLDQVTAKMEALRARGIGIALDDFGTGYSSLNYLNRLPLTQLKIDKSFVDHLLDDSSDMAIARTIVTLGQELGLDVIAEGVETEQQRTALQDIGCLTYQGYLFSRPLPAEALERFLAHWDPIEAPRPLHVARPFVTG